MHALVVFDPSTNERLDHLFEIEGVLYGDAALLLSRAQEAVGGLPAFLLRHEAVSDDFTRTSDQQHQ